MIHLIVPLLLAVLTFAPSLQDGRKSDGQSNKPNTTRHDAQRKKKVPPPATPESSQSKVNEPSFHYNQTNTEEPAKPVHNWVDFLNAISTAVVGAFTIVLAVVAYRQNLATRTAERAWIVAIPPEPPTRNPAGDYEIRWELENKGRTPAWVTALGSAGRTARTGERLPDDPPYTMAGPFPSEGTVLAPNGKVLRGLTIPYEQMTPVEQGEHTLYVFGTVKYRDIFGNEHEMRHCYRFKPEPTTADPSPRDFYVDGPAKYNRAT